MSFSLILSIICDAIGIAGFAMNLHFSKQSKMEKLRWVIVAIVLVISFSFTVYNGSELSRIKNIHRQASALCEHYSTSYCEEYIQEALTFLEENRERYPDSYDRAKQIYHDINDSAVPDCYDAARKMYGILKGISALNGEE